VLVLRDGADVLVQAEDGGIFFRDIIDDIVDGVAIKFAEIDGLDAFVFLFLFEYIFVDKLSYQESHFDPIDIIGQFAHIPDLSQHIPKRTEIDLIRVNFPLFFFKIDVALIAIKM
jgi:hypothetical protein